MHVAICATQTPFMHGGAELHVERLRQACEERAIDATVVRVPFKWYPPAEMVRNAMAWRYMDLTEIDGKAVDVAVATKFPTWVAKHPNMVCWLLHQHRQVYDLAHTEYDDMDTYPEGDHVKEIIRRLDNQWLPRCAKLFANSRNVADRLLRYNGIAARPLYHPPPHVGHYRCTGYGDTVIYPSRLSPLKRQDLAIQAMRHTKTPVRLAIVGAGSILDSLHALAKEAGVADRVSFTGFVPDEELLDLYGSCLGVLYLPVNEDYGYITLEAFLSSKPVVTATDSGGPLEFVSHGREGLVAEPDPRAIAAALDALYDSADAAEMGANALQRYEQLDISWDRVIDSLFGRIWRREEEAGGSQP